MKWRDNTMQAGPFLFRLALDTNGQWGYTISGPIERTVMGYRTKEEAKARAQWLAERLQKNTAFVFDM